MAKNQKRATVELRWQRLVLVIGLVIAASLGLAIALGLFLQRTKTGRIVRATAENRDMAEGLGVNASRIFALVFTVGCMLGTVGGALVVPSSAASLEMDDRTRGVTGRYRIEPQTPYCRGREGTGYCVVTTVMYM